MHKCPDETCGALCDCEDGRLDQDQCTHWLHHPPPADSDPDETPTTEFYWPPRDGSDINVMRELGGEDGRE